MVSYRHYRFSCAHILCITRANKNIHENHKGIPIIDALDQLKGKKKLIKGKKIKKGNT